MYCLCRASLTNNEILNLLNYFVYSCPNSNFVINFLFFVFWGGGFFSNDKFGEMQYTIQKRRKRNDVYNIIIQVIMVWVLV